MKLIEKFNTTNLDELCNSLTQEITQLATSDYKLKLMFVLVHIIEESQKALGEIDINNMVKELKTLVEKACEKTERQKEALSTWFYQDKLVTETIDGTNNEISTLEQDILEQLKQYDEYLNKLVEFRRKLSLPEIVDKKCLASCSEQ